MALEIIETGLDAINTEKVIESSISVVGNIFVYQRVNHLILLSIIK